MVRSLFLLQHGKMRMEKSLACFSATDETEKMFNLQDKGYMES